jgi:hypothetical protein
MDKLSLREFVERSLRDDISFAPWQKEIIASLERGSFAFRSFRLIKGDLQSALRWSGQLSLMRAYWSAGKETTMVSGYVTSWKKPPTLIFDEWIDR